MRELINKINSKFLVIRLSKWGDSEKDMCPICAQKWIYMKKFIGVDRATKSFFMVFYSFYYVFW